MKGLPLEDLDLSGTAGRIVSACAQTFRDRVELLGLELREDKIRLVQILILACFAVILSLLGLILVILTVLALLPEQLRAAGLGIMAAACALGALWAFVSLRVRLGRRNRVFAQTLAELEKDKACF